MTPENKWVLFKNFLHNELGITREDIREWIREAVRDEATRLVAQEFGHFSPREITKKVLYEHDLFQGDRFKREVVEAAGKLIAASLEVTPRKNLPRPVTCETLLKTPLPCGCSSVGYDHSLRKYTCLCGSCQPSHEFVDANREVFTEGS